MLSCNSWWVLPKRFNEGLSLYCEPQERAREEVEGQRNRKKTALEPRVLAPVYAFRCMFDVPAGVFVFETEPMTVAPSHATMKNSHPRYRPLSQPLSSLYREPPESNLLYAPCRVYFFNCRRNISNFLFLFFLCFMYKKSKLS